MEKKEKGINWHIMRRILMALFSVFIGVGVTVVMLKVYDPSTNNIKALSTVCMDIICIIILLVLMLSFTFEYYNSKRTTKLFVILLAGTIGGLFFDFLNWAFDGRLEFGKLPFWFTVASLCTASIVALIFLVYLYSYIDEAHNLGEIRIRTRISVIANIISFILSFVLAITGTAFEFVDGHYTTGTLYDFVAVIPILTLLYITGYIIKNVKRIGLHDVLSVVGYIVFMIFGTLIEGVYCIGTTYVSVAIADIFIFVMLQNEIIAHEKRKVQKWMQKSQTDELTGLHNRHAYEADLKKLEESDISEDFVYLSVDVNSLKAVNDTLGHYAGDELLVGASECLEKCFASYGTLYRTGGDEFIGLLYVGEKQLEKLKKDIEDITAKWHGKLVDGLTVSCGYVSRWEAKDSTVRQMGILADKRMYNAKNEYYKRTGIDRRKERYGGI